MEIKISLSFPVCSRLLVAIDYTRSDEGAEAERPPSS